MTREDFALVIGITTYPRLGASGSLEGPVKDATEFRDWLVQSAGVPDDQVKLILSDETDITRARPVHDDIDDAFEEIFEKAKQGARRLYVYFGGHGCSKAFSHVALLMANSTPSSPRAINTTSYHEGLATLKGNLFPEQVFFYDCCRNFDRDVPGRDHPWGEPSQLAP